MTDDSQPSLWKRWQERQRERLERLFQAQGKCPHGYKQASTCPRCSE